MNSQTFMPNIRHKLKARELEAGMIIPFGLPALALFVEEVIPMQDRVHIRGTVYPGMPEDSSGRIVIEIDGGFEMLRYGQPPAKKEES